MAAAFRKLLSSEPLCVGTRNEDQETVIGGTGNANGGSASLEVDGQQNTQVPTTIEMGPDLVSAPLKTITSFCKGRSVL